MKYNSHSTEIFFSWRSPGHCTVDH